MPADVTILRSRRQVLAAAIGGLAGAAAGALGRPSVAVATDGQPLVVGQNNTASETTVLRNTTTVAPGLIVETGAASAIHGKANGANGVEGEALGENVAGVWGFSSEGYGTSGMSNGGTGVYGSSQSATGVYAFSASWTKPALVARGSDGGAGVFGFAGVGAPPDAPLDTGVYGLATGYPTRQASAAVGVHGRSSVGTGVLAQADAGGTALRVVGKAVFSRSGTVTLAAGKSSITKSVAGLSSASLVFAVVRSGAGGVWVRKVAPTNGSFTVYLNKAVSSSTLVNWIAFN